MAETENGAAAPTATTNWANVNNWHWRSKNCLPWAQSYFKRVLADVESSNDSLSAKTTTVQTVEGDVEANQRKGKPIVVYDLNISISFESKVGEEEVKGRIRFPELLNDQTAEDIEFEISVEGDAGAEAKKTVKEFVKKDLVPTLKAKMLLFPSDLIAEQAKDLIIPAAQMAGHPTLKPFTPPPKTPSPAPAPPKPQPANDTMKGSTATVEQSVDFMCRAEDLYSVLLIPPKVSAWSRAPADIKPEVGTLFKLFGGMVSGYITELEENKKIGMRWRLKTWPEGHFSGVEITMEQGSETTTLRLRQTEVPIGEKEMVERNWTNFYWNSIKTVFGYGALLS